MEFLFSVFLWVSAVAVLSGFAWLIMKGDDAALPPHPIVVAMNSSCER